MKYENVKSFNKICVMLFPSSLSFNRTKCFYEIKKPSLFQQEKKKDRNQRMNIWKEIFIELKMLW